MDVDGPQWRALQAPPRQTRSGGQADGHAATLVRDAEELAILFYTSGSSGAKGVMVTHTNLLAGAAAVNSYLRHGRGDRLLAALPLAFDVIRSSPAPSLAPRWCSTTCSPATCCKRSTSSA
jgi:long-subunit acyl-CoA synthetase (AMP-forming)